MTHGNVVTNLCAAMSKLVQLVQAMNKTNSLLMMRTFFEGYASDKQKKELKALF